MLKRDMAKKGIAASKSVVLAIVTVFIFAGLIGGLVYIKHFNTKAINESAGEVCISEDHYKLLSQQAQQYQTLPLQQLAPPVQAPVEQVIERRDVQVLRDPLYPPLNRSDTVTATNNYIYTTDRLINVPTNDNNDTFRIVGYLINEDPEHRDKGGNTWKLFARERHRSQGDYYIIPADSNYDLKIPITDSIVRGQKLRDVYSIPSEVTFESPFLLKTPYKFVELPKTDNMSYRYF